MLRRRFLRECHNEHDFAIVDTVVKLLAKDYVVYLEYEIFFQAQSQKRLTIDILAKRGEKEILIEVGSLSEQRLGVGNRLKLLKKLKPHAKIYHITQWKNWLSSFDWDKADNEWQLTKHSGGVNDEIIR